jgi:hypothetical protein
MVKDCLRLEKQSSNVETTDGNYNPTDKQVQWLVNVESLRGSSV